MAEPTSIHLKHAWADLKAERVAVVVLVLTAILVTAVEYFFLAGSFRELFPDVLKEYAPGIWYGAWSRVPEGADPPWWGVLAPWAWWLVGMVVFWLIVPMAAAKLLGFRIRDLGLSTKGVLPKLWVYAVLYLVVLIGVWWASTQKGFTSMYPMLQPWYCEQWCWLVLLSWWGIYAVQFFIVEFFFRGWMLFTLEKRMGMASIAVMIVPYCAIHYHKPFTEALGAIIAGLVLGWLALRTRSIWGGVLIHCAVAITMDVASLMQGEWGLPKQFWPG